MRINRRTTYLAAALVAAQLSGCAAWMENPPYLATQEKYVGDMLALAEISSDDIVYDLGSGDGRIVIAAAVQYGARGVGVEYDEELVKLSRRNALEAGVADRVEFRLEDFYEADISDATVVMMYLFEQANERLKPRLVEQLAPDARIVTHKYTMPGWEPAKTGDKVYLYKLPPVEQPIAE